MPLKESIANMAQTLIFHMNVPYHSRVCIVLTVNYLLNHLLFIVAGNVIPSKFFIQKNPIFLLDKVLVIITLYIPFEIEANSLIGPFSVSFWDIPNSIKVIGIMTQLLDACLL